MSLLGIVGCVGHPCPLCGEKFTEGEEILDFWFVGLSDQRVCFLDDSVAHPGCLYHWELRDVFIEHWNSKAGELRLGRQWQLYVDEKNGRVQFKKEFLPFWFIVIITAPVFMPLEWMRELRCWWKGIDPQTGRKYGGPCPYCREQLPHPDAQQCLKCGWDWHDRANPVKRG